MKRTTEERAQAIIAAYENGMPIFEMQTRFGGSSATIYKLLTRYGIARRPDERPWRRTAVDETFFDTLTPASAWVLGLWLTDGSIDRRNTSQRALIGFADEDLLRTVHRLLNTQAAITLSTDGKFWSFRFTSGHICDRLDTLGVKQPKERRVHLPEIDPSLLHHLVRGIFDGDGHVSESIFPGYDAYCNVQFAYPSESFLTDLSVQLRDAVGIETRVAVGDGCWQLRMRHAQAVTLLHWLYRDSNGLRLERKYQRALAFIGPTIA